MDIKEKFQNILKREPGNKNKKIIIGVSVVSVFLLGLYAGISTSYSEKFIPGTMVGSEDISGKTVAEANDVLQKRYSGKSYVVKENGKEVTRVTGKDIGMEGDFESYLADVNENQNKWSWIVSGVTGSQKNELPSGIAFDEEKFKNKFDQVEFNSGERTASEDATVELSGGSFKIRPEIYGNTLDIEKVNSKIRDEIAKGNSDIEIKDCYIQPELKSDDPELEAGLDEINKLKDVSITYNIAGNKIEVPKETITSWIIYDTESGVTLDQEAVKTYLSELSSKYSTLEKVRSFNSTLKGNISIGGGVYGWIIATNTETELLTEEFLKGEDIERTPKISGTGYHSDGTDIGNSYIEVDLTAQHMWLYKDGSLVIDTAIVSGNPNKGNATPTGVFYVWKKQQDKILRGEDYATPVSYWLPIDWTGVGIHDANWQSSFGGDLYLTRGSHGCINTPMNIVSQLYNMIDVGIPVIVH